MKETSRSRDLSVYQNGVAREDDVRVSRWKLCPLHTSTPLALAGLKRDNTGLLDVSLACDDITVSAFVLATLRLFCFCSRSREIRLAAVFIVNIVSKCMQL